MTGFAAADYPCDAVLDPNLKTKLQSYDSSSMASAFEKFLMSSEAETKFSDRGTSADAKFYVYGVPVDLGFSDRKKQFSEFKRLYQSQFKSQMSSTDIVYTMQEFMPQANIDAWLQCIQRHPPNGNSGLNIILEERAYGALLQMRWTQDVPSSPPVLSDILVGGGSTDLSRLKLPTSLVPMQTYLYKIEGDVQQREIHVDIASNYGHRSLSCANGRWKEPHAHESPISLRTWGNSLNHSSHGVDGRDCVTGWPHLFPIFKIDNLEGVQEIDFFRNGQKLGTYTLEELAVAKVQHQGALTVKGFPLKYSPWELYSEVRASGYGWVSDYPATWHPNPSLKEAPWIYTSGVDYLEAWTKVAALAERDAKYVALIKFSDGHSLYQNFESLARTGSENALKMLTDRFNERYR